MNETGDPAKGILLCDPGCDLGEQALNAIATCEPDGSVATIEQLTAAGVYFVRGRATRLIKIGCAENAVWRLIGLQNQCADRLDLIAFIPSPQPRHIERALHIRFCRYREHGEWFRPGRELLLYIDSLREPPDTDFYIDEFEPYRHPAQTFDRLPVIDIVGKRGGKTSFRRARSLPANKERG